MSSRLTGQKELNRRLNAIKDGRPILRTVQLKAVAEAKSRVPRKTGHTARTIAPGDSGPTFTIVQAGGAAPFIEFDTKPHTIRPKRARALFFPSQAATTDRFGSGAQLKFNKTGRLSAGSVRKYGSAAFVHAKSVRHPGTKAQPFLVPAAVAAIKAVGLKPIIDAWNRAA